MMKERRQATIGGERRSFASLARTAIEKHVPEARIATAWWSLGTNSLWIRWAFGGGYAYLGLHRHLDWLSGEVGVSREPVEMGALYALPGVPALTVPGYRIRLGHLLESGDRWWPAGDTEGELIERLEWLVLQLHVKGTAYFRRYPEGQR